MADFKDILPGSEAHLTEEELLRYLDANTSEEKKHAIEQKLADTSFENDAVEGLQQMKAETLSTNVAQLNSKLREQLLSQKRKKDKHKIRNLQWGVLAVVIILLLCILAYVVIRIIR